MNSRQVHADRQQSRGAIVDDSDDEDGDSGVPTIIASNGSQDGATDDQDEDDESDDESDDNGEDMEKGVGNHGGDDPKDDCGDSSESAQAVENPCGECLDPLLDGEKKYRTKNCHYECGVTVRAA